MVTKDLFAISMDYPSNITLHSVNVKMLHFNILKLKSGHYYYDIPQSMDRTGSIVGLFRIF